MGVAGPEPDIFLRHRVFTCRRAMRVLDALPTSSRRRFNSSKNRVSSPSASGAICGGLRLTTPRLAPLMDFAVLFFAGAQKTAAAHGIFKRPCDLYCLIVVEDVGIHPFLGAFECELFDIVVGALGLSVQQSSLIAKTSFGKTGVLLCFPSPKNSPHVNKKSDF